MAFGIDYSFGSGLSTGQMKAAGVRFVCRYLSWQPNAKNIDKAEFENLVKAGMYVVFVWEATGRDLTGGHHGGAHDAEEANRQVEALGAKGCPIYFAPCDFDAAPGDQPAINDYLDGAASVIGRSRTGFYGGYYPLKRAFDAGKMHYGWQTYAWSGGQWDHRAHLHQYQNGARLGPAEVDFDRSVAADCGWWPRPKSPAKPDKPKPPDDHKPVVAPPDPAPAHKAGDPYRHEADGKRSMAEIASGRGTTAAHIWDTTATALTDADSAAMAKLILPAGWPYYTSNE